MTCGWSLDSQPLRLLATVLTLTRPGTGTMPLPPPEPLCTPLQGPPPLRGLLDTAARSLSDDGPPVTVIPLVVLNAGDLLLFSVGFPPSLLVCGDIEPDPGPRVTYCVWGTSSLLNLFLLTPSPPPPPPPAP